MCGDTSVLQNECMHSLYCDRLTTPYQHSRLTHAQRERRATWQASIDRGLAESRATGHKPRFRGIGQLRGRGPVQSLPPRTVRPAC